MTNKEEQIHFIQRKILFDLLFEQSIRFADLKPFEMESSQFMFHIKKLIELGWVSKYGSSYKLTTLGKEVANRLDASTLNMSVQTKVTTVLCAIKDTGDEKEYLIYKRLKNPFYGCMGFPTKKPLWGQSLIDVAKDGLKEETSLEFKDTPELFAVRHYLVYSSDNLLIEDKLMHAYLFKNPSGDLIPAIEGDYFWMPENHLKQKIVKPQEEFWEFYDALKSFKSAISFREISVVTNNF